RTPSRAGRWQRCGRASGGPRLGRSAYRCPLDGPSSAARACAQAARTAPRSPAAPVHAARSFLRSTRNPQSPARLRDARQLAHQRALAEADPAEAELPHEAARPAADLAAVVRPHRELGRALRFQDEAFLRQLLLLKTQYGTASRARAAARAPLRPSSPSCRS